MPNVEEASQARWGFFDGFSRWAAHSDGPGVGLCWYGFVLVWGCASPAAVEQLPPGTVMGMLFSSFRNGRELVR